MIFTFIINDVVLGIEVDKIQEVLSEIKAQSVPLSAPCIAGLVNYRGNILTSIDLSSLFQFSNEKVNKILPIQIILVDEQGFLALQAERCLDVVDSSGGDTHAPLEGMSTPFKDFVKSIISLKERNIYLLDTDKMIRTISDMI